MQAGVSDPTGKYAVAAAAAAAERRERLLEDAGMLLYVCVYIYYMCVYIYTAAERRERLLEDAGMHTRGYIKKKPHTHIHM